MSPRRSGMVRFWRVALFMIGFVMIAVVAYPPVEYREFLAKPYAAIVALLGGLAMITNIGVFIRHLAPAGDKQLHLTEFNLVFCCGFMTTTLAEMIYFIFSGAGFMGLPFASLGMNASLVSILAGVSLLLAGSLIELAKIGRA